jgi:hypothetical protein
MMTILKPKIFFRLFGFIQFIYNLLLNTQITNKISSVITEQMFERLFRIISFKAEIYCYS